MSGDDGQVRGGGVPYGGDMPGNVAEALRMGDALADFLNSPAATELDGAACGEVLVALGEIQAKLAAAYATFLRRFDAADAHDADGYGSSSAWLAARGRMTKRDARAAVREMRQFSERPGLHDAVATGDISKSWADAIARWTRKLPEGMRADTDKILLEAAEAGASLEDLATIAAAAIERWRSTRPDPDDDFDFQDRHVRLGLTFGGAGVIRGDLTPECAAAVTAVLEALGKRRGPEDDRSEGQRFHDALAEACHLLLRARLVPGRAGADTQVIAHIPISQLREVPGAADLEDAWLRATPGEGHGTAHAPDPPPRQAPGPADPEDAQLTATPGEEHGTAHAPGSPFRRTPGAADLEDAWLRARLGEGRDPGTAYLAGKDAEVAACDSLTVPVVTGHADMTVIDKIIALVLAGHSIHAASPARHRPRPDGTASHDGTANDSGTGACSAANEARPAPDRARPAPDQARPVPGEARDKPAEASASASAGYEHAGCRAHVPPPAAGEARSHPSPAAADTGAGSTRTSSTAADTAGADATGAGSARAGGTTPAPASGTPAVPVPAGAWQALRHAVARLAIDFVSGPGGLASALRTGLLQHPYGTPSLPLDIGLSDSIPGHIRRAVMLRDQHCAWPGGCDRPAAACDVHHIRHKADGGETSVRNCGVFCEFHHETCIHRWGWKITLRPDGTMEAHSPDGRQVLRKHGPPRRPVTSGENDPPSQRAA